MAKPYDVTTKYLLEAHPGDWLRLLGVSAEQVEILDADLSTVIAEADKVYLLKIPHLRLLDVEVQSGFKLDEIERFLEYSILLRRRYGLPVQTVVVLLRPEADHNSDVTGTEASDLWTATYLLMGLRYAPDVAKRLMEGVRSMRESLTYQAILQEGREEGRERGREEGRTEEARRLLLRQGTKRFGEPDAATQIALEAIHDLEQFEVLAVKLLDVESWQDLLA